jgi:hypothetical protein
MSGKTFDEQASTMAELRVRKYLQARTGCIESVQFWGSCPRLDRRETYPDFSSFEETTGWNEVFINAYFISELFVDFVEYRQEFFQSFLDSIKVDRIQAIDFTFESAKRTKTYKGSGSGQAVTAVELNSLLFSLNGSGQITAFRRAKNERRRVVFYYNFKKVFFRIFSGPA